MKTVIRRGVFETNSSSTHSLSLKQMKKADAKSIDKEASFEIRSPLAKAVTLLGLIDNAESEFARQYYIRDEYSEKADYVKKETLNRIREINPSLLENVELENISSYDILQILMKMDNLENFYNVSDFEDFGDYYDKRSEFEYFFYDDFQEKITLQKVKKFIFEEYAKIVNKPYDEAKEEIDFEAFAYVELKDALEDEKNAKENVEKLMNTDYRIRIAFEKSGSDNLVEFAKKFLYENYLEFKNAPGRKYCCHRYFSNGCLDTCDCGFENYSNICMELSIRHTQTEEEIREKVRDFLSDKYKLVATEKLGYSFFIRSGEIF